MQRTRKIGFLSSAMAHARRLVAGVRRFVVSCNENLSGAAFL
jgi:hypothetical protein